MKPILTTLSVALLAVTMVAPSVAFAATGTCASGDASNISTAHRVGPKTLGAAKTAPIVPVPTCELADVSSALGTLGGKTVRKSIEANSALIAEVQSEGYTAADILGASRKATTITIYVTQH